MFCFRPLVCAALVFMGLAAPFIAYGRAPRTLYVTPQGAGSRDGSSWETAGVLLDLPTLVARAGAGGSVLLRADLGTYKITEPIPLNHGGSANQPVTVEGVDSSGNPMNAMIVGTRSDPYRVDGASGSAVFRLEHGANHLHFKHLSFRNQGNGCFYVAADIRDLVIEHVDARNVRRFLEDYAARTAPSATIDGLTIRNVEVKGFSKGAVRLKYNTHDVLMEDVLGDSERQDGDDFAEGVALEGTVHDVVFRRVTMRNSQDTLHKFWNGDGFATEWHTYNIRFVDTVSSGNTDAGYDLKSHDTVLIRTLAEDNANNYKMWGRGISISNCVGRNPYLRGGTGSQTQVEIDTSSGYARSADVLIANCKFLDSDPSTTIFKVEGGARLTVRDTSIMKNPAAKLSLIDEGGALIFKGENW